MSDIIDYSIYDEDTDGFFTVKVTQSKAGELFQDGLKTARFIASLKAQGYESIPASQFRQGHGAIPTKGKKKPFRWSVAETNKLLQLCAFIRPSLRQKKVPLEVYNNLAEKLKPFMSNDHKLEPATGVQCRERIRTLKLTFEEMKKKRQAWDFLDAMTHIWDAPLSVVQRQLGTTYVVDQPKFVTSSGNSTEAHLSEDIMIEGGESMQLESPLPLMESAGNPFGATYVVNQPKVVTSANEVFGATYVVNQPKVVTSANEVFGATYVVSQPKFATSSANEAFGATYIVGQPKFVTSSGNSTQAHLAEDVIIECDHEIQDIITKRGDQIKLQSHPFLMESADELLGATYVDSQPKVVTSSEHEPDTSFASNDLRDQHDFAAHQSMFENSSLPSETFFAKNLNAKSTPDAFRSPAKKKTSEGAAGGVRTPKSNTPKRKNKYANVLWGPEHTHAFLKECVKRKEFIQSGNVPNYIWKEISEELEKAEYSDCDWQVCRYKFSSLNLFFEKSMLKVNGVMGRSKWPHYEAFLAIHDLPPDYMPPDENFHVHEEDEKKLWTSRAENLLITLYKQKRSSFKSTKSFIKHTALYKEIASDMQKFEHGANADQCQRHMNEMLQFFHEEFDRQKKSGEAPTEWEWYPFFLLMEKGSANLNAPCVFSAGASTSYSIDGSDMPIVEKRGTRTRSAPAAVSSDDSKDADDPSLNNQSESKPKTGAKKKLYKTFAQEMQEKAAKAKADMVNEVRLLRLSQEEKSIPRTAALQTMAEAMKDISAYFKNAK